MQTDTATSATPACSDKADRATGFQELCASFNAMELTEVRPARLVTGCWDSTAKRQSLASEARFACDAGGIHYVEPCHQGLCSASTTKKED